MAASCRAVTPELPGGQNDHVTKRGCRVNAAADQAGDEASAATAQRRAALGRAARW